MKKENKQKQKKGNPAGPTARPAAPSSARPAGASVATATPLSADAGAAGHRFGRAPLGVHPHARVRHVSRADRGTHAVR